MYTYMYTCTIVFITYTYLYIIHYIYNIRKRIPRLLNMITSHIRYDC